MPGCGGATSLVTREWAGQLTMEQPLQWPYCSYLGRCLHCHDTRWKTGEEERGGEGRGVDSVAMM